MLLLEMSKDILRSGKPLMTNGAVVQGSPRVQNSEVMCQRHPVVRSRITLREMSGPESLAGITAGLEEESASAEEAGGAAEGVPITELAADGA